MVSKNIFFESTKLLPQLPANNTAVSTTVGHVVADSSLPWTVDCINPRTGLKGYESDWTDDDFRTYFDITDIEWEEIVETMKPYL